jgi:hypothetical protein
VWLTINFEEKQHHMWVDRKEHIRDIMQRKRYNKAAVAPAGLKGKLEGLWNKNPVAKLIRRPDVKGEIVRFPKKAPEWDRESRKVMVVVKFQGHRRRAKEIPCEMPLKEVLKWFLFNTKKATVRTKIGPPWAGWTEITVRPKPGVSECRLNLRESVEGKYMGKMETGMKEDLRELHWEKVRKTLAAMEENLKEADDQELRDIGEKLERELEGEPQERPEGRAILLHAAARDFEWVTVEQNEDMLSIMKRSRYNPNVMWPRCPEHRNCGPWLEGHIIDVRPIGFIKWEDERRRARTMEKEFERDLTKQRLEKIEQMLKERAEAREKAKTREDRIWEAQVEMERI